MDFQQMILTLSKFWSAQGCLPVYPYDIEKGAGTLNPMTMLRTLGPEPWRVAYVEPSRRPADGRYGENPNRLYQHHQFQVIIKPAIDNIQDVYIASLQELGLDLLQHDLRFVESNWENPTFGAAGYGWEVWLDGMEITQFTYFQQMGSIATNPVSVEITIGLERLACYLQDKENVYDLDWSSGVKYGDIFKRAEYEHSKYTFEHSDPALLAELFGKYEHECNEILKEQLVYPAYDYVLKCSHAFNLLDARGVLGDAERIDFMSRIRHLAERCAVVYIGDSVTN